MRNQCNVCGHINGHAPGCPEAPEPEYYCCAECGTPIENGEGYFEINGDKLCESCVRDRYHRLMDYDDIYTYEDYMTDRYERERE